MKCKNCRKDIIIPRKAYLNLEHYNVGGSILVASECCNTGYTVRMEIGYKITEYTGKKTEDDWGKDLSK